MNATETPGCVVSAVPTRPAVTITTPRLNGSSKIQGRHYDRQAVVYVRQSQPQQVLKHRESGELQYNLVRLAVELGWSEEQVCVVDEDQGISATTSEGRRGFQWLLAEVALDHVGVVLGIEMSRLARSCKDSYHLLEVCALFGTLLADKDGVYDPIDYNDRLLLGLKATMSEAELHIMRGRLNAGRVNKAMRCELFNHAPIGYVRVPSGPLALDPDEQAQHVVRLIFEKFEELGSAAAVLRYLVKNGIRLGVRPHGGPNRGQLEWRRPSISTILNLLRHPLYAGAYAYARHPTDPRRKIPGRRGTGKKNAPMDQWPVLRKDCLPAYITWEQYLANQKRLQQNRTLFPSLGSPREGTSLLGGLSVCGHCGHRMLVEYSGKHNYPCYRCKQQRTQYGTSDCQCLSAAPLDEFVSRQVLRILEPAAIELSLQAVQNIQRDRDRITLHWQQRLKRAGYEADRTLRQYNAVEPENRLVARELERRWDQALREQHQLEEEFDCFQQEQSLRLTAEEREAISALSQDIPALWQAATTTPMDRQTIIRHLVERVVVTVQGKTEVVDVTLHWAGGYVSQHQIRRTVARYDQLRDYEQLLNRIAELRKAQLTAAQVAEQLNRDGYRPPKRRTTFNRAEVHELWLRCAPETYEHLLRPDEWWLSDLALELHMPQPTLHEWRQKGWVHARKLSGVGGRWILWADAEELERLRRIRSHRRHRLDEHCPKELTTPKPRNDT